MEVQILSTKLIKPSSPTLHHLQNQKISFTDQYAPLMYLPLIFYYPNMEGGADTHDVVKTRRDRLEKSLSEVLTRFYPFAGRFIKEDLSVDCNDQGVEYSEARVSGRVDEVVVNGRVDINVVDPLVPNVGEADANTTPLLVIQVNTFDCGGLAIVVHFPHRIADAATMAAFMNGWATASREGVSQVIHPCFDLPSAIPARNITLPSTESPATPMDTSKVRIIPSRFVFDAKALKAKVMAAAADSSSFNIRPPTRHEVVSAAIWRALIGASQVKQGCLRASALVHAINLRGKTVPPMPDNTFGNFCALCVARFEPDEAKMELHDLALLIRDSIRYTVKNCSKALDSDDFFWTVFNSFKEGYVELYKQKDLNVHQFTSWCRIPFYEADFGWGKPSWVSSVDGDLEMVCLNDTPCGDGVEAWVSLNEQDMIRFQQDPNILTFTS